MFTDINGIRTNYVDEGEGEVVLLLHGWGSNIKLWNNLVEHLKPFYRVVALDMAGFGETDEPPIAWCVDNYVNYVLEFCKQLGIKKAVLIGHSFGGRVIIKLMARENNPLEIPKIILTDSAGIMPKKSTKSKIRQRFFKMNKGILNFAPVKKLFPNALDNLRKKHGSADYNAATPVMRASLVKVVNEDLTSLLPLIKPSTLLIWGKNDDATPLSDGEMMEKLIPDSGLVTLENAGHYAFIDQWFTFSRVVDSFLGINIK